MEHLKAKETPGSNGAVWGTATEDLNATLARWDAGRGVDSHVNDEVDVAMSVLAGSGTAVVGGLEVRLESGSVLVIPKGVSRSFRAGDEGITYLNVHKRRALKLTGLTSRPKPP